MKIYLVSPEDLVISKIIWIQQIQSNLQIDDINALTKIKNLDWHYIHRWIAALKLNTFDIIKKV